MTNEDLIYSYDGREGNASGENGLGSYHSIGPWAYVCDYIRNWYKDSLYQATKCLLYFPPHKAGEEVDMDYDRGVLYSVKSKVKDTGMILGSHYRE